LLWLGQQQRGVWRWRLALRLLAVVSLLLGIAATVVLLAGLAISLGWPERVALATLALLLFGARMRRLAHWAESYFGR
jgi:hypothetical protein